MAATIGGPPPFIDYPNANGDVSTSSTLCEKITRAFNDGYDSAPITGSKIGAVLGTATVMTAAAAFGASAKTALYGAALGTAGTFGVLILLGAELYNIPAPIDPADNAREPDENPIHEDALGFTSVSLVDALGNSGFSAIISAVCGAAIHTAAEGGALGTGGGFLTGSILYYLLKEGGECISVITNGAIVGAFAACIQNNETIIVPVLASGGAFIGRTIGIGGATGAAIGAAACAGNLFDSSVYKVAGKMLALGGASLLGKKFGHWISHFKPVRYAMGTCAATSQFAQSLFCCGNRNH